MTNPAKPSIDLARLRDILDAYGADPARWPEQERAAAVTLCEHDAEAAELCLRAAELDAGLDSWEVASPSPRLQAIVAEVPAKHPRETAGSHAGALAARGFGFGLWKMLMAGALACMVGVVTGSVSWSDDTTSDDGWDDVTTLAFGPGSVDAFDSSDNTSDEGL